MHSGEKTRRAGIDAIALLSYLAFAVYVLGHVWASPQQRQLADNHQDQVFFEWVLTHATRFFTHGDNPFFTDQLNAPLGVNLMANTSVLGLALPLAPITLLFGAGVTFAVISTLALAGTAASWYFVLSRHLVNSRAAAYVGALFCGFAPAMISQSTGHPNIAGQYLIPFIIWNILRLREPGPTLKRGLTLGAVVLYQSFINEEVLFLTAVGLFIFLIVCLHPREYAPLARRALPAIGIGALFAGVLLAYPLYHQFLGRQSYQGLPEFVHGFSTDLGSFTAFSRRSILAPEMSQIEKMGGPTEENTFFGLPLLGLLLASAAVLWRQRAARAVFVTAVVFAALSLGTMVKYKGEDTGWHGPWNWVHVLPLFDSVVPTRLGIAMTPLVGVLLSMLIDRYIVGLPATASVSVATASALEGDEPLTATAATTTVTEANASGPAKTTTATATKPTSGDDEDDDDDISDISDKSVDDDDENTPASRWLWAAALAVALFPLIPTPQPADDRPVLPTFFSSGLWRDTIPENSTVVALPLGWWEGLDAMRWSTQAGQDFKIAGGYFLVPNPDDPENKATFYPVTPPTMQLINTVGGDGTVPEITTEQKAQARADATWWNADFLVLPEQHANSEPIRLTVEQLYGPGQHIADVWVWNVG